MTCEVIRMETFTYNGWLCGNDSYPTSIKKKYAGKINKEVYGFNRLAKKISEVEPTWDYIDQEYRIKRKVNGHSLGRKAWDHYIKFNSRDILIEFDGSQHYTEMKNYLKDREYTQAAESLGFKVVRIPYFIQLNSKLIAYYIGAPLTKISIDHTFLQGFRVNGKDVIPEFNDTNAQEFRNTLGYQSVLPNDFCVFGLKRFQDEMISLSNNGLDSIVQEIKQSILLRANDYDWPEEYALPPIKWK